MMVGIMKAHEPHWYLERRGSEELSAEMLEISSAFATITSAPITCYSKKKRHPHSNQAKAPLHWPSQNVYEEHGFKQLLNCQAHHPIGHHLPPLWLLDAHAEVGKDVCRGSSTAGCKVQEALHQKECVYRAPPVTTCMSFAI
jgi:hypothetical protein